MLKPTQIKGNNWMVTVNIKNMIRAGLIEEQYMNPEELAKFFIHLWEYSGKNRKAAAAVCVTKDGLYHMHMACYTSCATTMNQVRRIFLESHVDLVKGTKTDLRAYLEKTGKYEERGEQVLYTIGLDNIEDNQDEYRLMRRKQKMKNEVPIWEKSNLTLEEAAGYFGIGINKLRQLTNDSNCEFVLWCGTKRLVKRKVFEEYLRKMYSI